MTPVQPPSRDELYAQRLTGACCTSTLIQGTSSMFAAIDCGVCDIGLLYSRPPYAFWQMTVDASARVFDIDGPQAWHDLCGRYPAEGTTGREIPDSSGDTGRLVPDWSAVAAGLGCRPSHFRRITDCRAGTGRFPIGLDLSLGLGLRANNVAPLDVYVQPPDARPPRARSIRTGLEVVVLPHPP